MCDSPVGVDARARDSRRAGQDVSLADAERAEVDPVVAVAREVGVGQREQGSDAAADAAQRGEVGADAAAIEQRRRAGAQVDAQ